MADKIKMIAGDTLHITAISSEPLRVGDAFEVDNEADAVRLEAAGHKRASTRAADAAQAAKPKASAPKSRKPRSGV